MAKRAGDKIQPRNTREQAAKKLAMTGMAATAAGLWLGAPQAGATSKPAAIFACYSDSTNALSYLKPPADKCGTGQTLISWNAQGPQGAKGAQGQAGPQGNQGATGKVGAQGATGKTGGRGAPGSQGAAGPQGAQGGAGAPGAQGSIGPQGVQGSAGPQGVQGSAGPQGVQGSAGPQGVQGGVGPAGAVSGYYDAGTSATGIGRFYTSVATLRTASGTYAVTGTALGSENPDLNDSSSIRLVCYVAAISHNGTVTSKGTEGFERIHTMGGDSVEVTTIGTLHVKSTSHLAELCATSQKVDVYSPAIQAVRLSKSNNETTAGPRVPQHRFSRVFQAPSRRSQ
jgi:hypothetical protein